MLFKIIFYYLHLGTVKADTYLNKKFNFFVFLIIIIFHTGVFFGEGPNEILKIAFYKPRLLVACMSFSSVYS